MHTFSAMNTTVVTDRLPLHAQPICENWFAFVEHTLSRFRPDSELSRLNLSEGQPFAASTLLYEVLSVADRYYKETNGLFNPYLGGILSELGYDRSFESIGGQAGFAAHPRVPALPGALSAHPACLLDDKLQRISILPGLSVDLGGIAKGWTAAHLAQLLHKEGIEQGAIGAGGDIAFWGTGRESWELDIADPTDAGHDLLTLHVRGTVGAATSSTVKRSWKDREGRTHNHIIDGRRAASASSGLIQVTLLAANLVDAEVYAKCVLLLGEHQGLKWLADNHPECAALCVRSDGTIVESDRLHLHATKGGERL